MSALDLYLTGSQVGSKHHTCLYHLHASTGVAVNTLIREDYTTLATKP
jgi:hypothetical protein